MDHTDHVRLTPAELNSATLAGATVYGPNDDTIGSVAHVHGIGAESQVIVDVGGFLGLGTKPVALRASQMDFMRDEDGEVHAVTAFTEDQLKSMPEHREPGGDLPWPAS
ncbi:PRC-barrel domain containing protein [Mesorhizobium sp. NPDC059054]|uniref:PRC-barrel domain containing protein n=1 Tax=Mesorhizobium sp. NPDC059054 TaxID=3346711 RepID=UPI00368073B0